MLATSETINGLDLWRKEGYLNMYVNLTTKPSQTLLHNLRDKVSTKVHSEIHVSIFKQLRSRYIYCYWLGGNCYNLGGHCN